MISPRLAFPLRLAVLVRLALPVVVLALSAAVLAGCDGATAQADFRADAAQPASGYTQVNADGTVVSRDADDWRVSPLYSTRVLVNPARPNPVGITTEVSLQVQVVGFDVVPGGMQLVAFTQAGRRVLDSDPGATSSGFYTFTFVPADFNDGGAPGLRRVILFDARSEPITYGDIRVE